MITFRRIRRRDFFHFLWAYYVLYIYACVNVMKTHIILHVLIWAKHLFLKWQWPKKGHAPKYLCSFGPFWAIFRPKRRLHVPILAKPFFQKQECPKKGHAASDPGAGCTPWKRQKLYFVNKNAPKRDMLRPIRAPVAPPENDKSFFPKTRNPIFGTVLNDNPMITLR